MAAEKFMYVAWFQDGSLPADDEDHEWPACFWIRAESSERALAWGDHLSTAYAAAVEGTSFIRSYVDSDASSDDSLPEIADGHEAKADEIGW